MEDDILAIDNMEIHKKDNFVIVSVNPKLYSLEVIYSAAYIFIDRAFVMIDGDPREEVLVQLRPKSNTEIETLGREFNNELINYSVYLYRTLRSQNIREDIVKRALATNAQINPSTNTQTNDQIPKSETPTAETVIHNDLEKTAKPWNLKRGIVYHGKS